MDFPLLKTFQVDESTVNFLNKKLQQFSSQNKLISSKDSGDDIYVSETGVHTGNLCLWDDPEYQDFLSNDLLEMCSSQLNIDKKHISFKFNHFFDYREGGEVKLHNHVTNEDFVLFIYTNTCSSGHTVFHLNHLFEKGKIVKLKPTFGLGAIFSSMLYHEAEYTNEPKKIFVVAINIDLD